MWAYNYNDKYELYHHGIKGQQWGVRNGPPYPIEDKVLRKGTRLNSISSRDDSVSYKNRGKWMYTFNPNDEWDSKVYRGPFAKYKTLEKSQDFVYEHSYVTVKDLNMPTKQERFDEFVNLYKSKRIRTTLDLMDKQTEMRMYDLGSKEAQKVKLWRLKTEEDYNSAYQILNQAMQNANRYATTDSYMKIMEEKWDAMVDDNNREVYNRTHNPIIIFRANEALQEIGQSRIVDMKEILKNHDDVNKELAKYGERATL